jgi:hypothetical protein
MAVAIASGGGVVGAFVAAARALRADAGDEGFELSNRLSLRAA